MKRDWDLVREILLKVEALPPKPNRTVGGRDFTDYPGQLVAHHIQILHQAGFLEAIVEPTSGGLIADAQSLTWEGHEFLETIKNEPVWKKLLEKLKSTGKTVPMELVSKFGADILVQWLSRS